MLFKKNILRALGIIPTVICTYASALEPRSVEVQRVVTDLSRWIAPALNAAGYSEMPQLKVSFDNEIPILNSYSCGDQTIQLGSLDPADGTTVAHEFGHALYSHLVGSCEKFSGIDGQHPSLLILEGYADFVSMAFTGKTHVGDSRYFEFSNNYTLEHGFPQSSVSLANYAKLYSDPELNVWKAYPQLFAPITKGLEAAARKKPNFLEPHLTGRILASALNAAASEIGKDKMLRLIVRAIAAHPVQISFRDSYSALLKADSKLFNGAHFETIQNAFIRHGLVHPILVTVFDNDFDFLHPTLKDNLWTNPGETVDGVDNDGNGYVDDVHGFDIESRTGDTKKIGDGCGHGTPIADIVANRQPNVHVLGVRFSMAIFLKLFSQEHRKQTLADMSEALSFSIKQGAKIVNFSGGISQSECVEYLSQTATNFTAFDIAETCTTAIADWSLMFKSLMDRYPEALFVYAAGNKGEDNDQIGGAYPCKIAAKNSICVANVEQDPIDQKFTVSGSTGKLSVHLAVVGRTNKLACGGTVENKASLGKSSAAAAHVSRAAVQILMQNPSLSPLQIKEIILGTVTRHPVLQDLVQTGGILDLERALMAARLSLTYGNQVPAAIEAAQDAR